jgi:hypothetical protein
MHVYVDVCGFYVFACACACACVWLYMYICIYLFGANAPRLQNPFGSLGPGCHFKFRGAGERARFPAGKGSVAALAATRCAAQTSTTPQPPFRQNLRSALGYLPPPIPLPPQPASNRYLSIYPSLIISMYLAIYLSRMKMRLHLYLIQYLISKCEYA